jgi:competence protein ComEA
MRVADSAAAAQRKQKGKTQGSTKGRAGRGKKAGVDSSAGVNAPQPGLLDRRGYVGKRLDLDVATAAQIDSLPGVSPLMARRIVQDRLRRGPFLSMSGLQRVSGVGRGFIQKIDTMVTFSGTYAFPSPNDTVIKTRKRKR